MMAVMTAQPPLPVVLEAGGVNIGEAVGLVGDADGGRVFLRGELVYAWSVGDVALRRLAAGQLVAIRAARVGDVAAAFGVDNGTLWRWGQHLSATGVSGLVPDKRGPKGPSLLSPQLVADITARRAAGTSFRKIATATGVSYTSVRRVCAPATGPADGSDHVVEHDAGPDSDAGAATEDADPAGDTDPGGAQLPGVATAGRPGRRAGRGPVGEAAPRRTRVRPRRAGTPGGAPAGDPRPGGHSPVALRCNGV